MNLLKMKNLVCLAGFVSQLEKYEKYRLTYGSLDQTVRVQSRVN